MRRWVAGCAALAVLLLAHTLWDYVEARALKSALATDAPDFGEEPMPPDIAPDRDAVPYLVAATALARWVNDSGDRAIDLGLPNEEAANALSSAAIGYLSRTLAANADALHLLDEAIARTFVGFPPGRHPPDLSGLFQLKRLESFRAMVEATQGDGSAAARSVVAEAALESPALSPMAIVGEQTWLLSGRALTARDAQFVLSTSAPDDASLAALDAALAAEDDDGVTSRYLTVQRDRLISGSLHRLGRYDGSFGRAGVFGDGLTDRFTSWLDRIERPWLAHRLRTFVHDYAGLITAGHRPWPDRIDAVTTAAAQVPPFSLGLDSLKNELQRAAADIAAVRAARVAVAVERYRRAHDGAVPSSLDALMPTYLNAIPADPFSHGPLHFRTMAKGYVVYSVGADGADDRGEGADGGTVTGTPTGAHVRPSGDVGVHITR